jgi:hypothetical protein
MTRVAGFVMACVAVLVLPAVGGAAVITFGTSVIPILVDVGPQSEGAFQYEALSGAWEVNGLSSASPKSLFTFFNSNNPEDGVVVGQVVEITSPGNLFRFDSVDFRTISPANSDDVLITGLLGGTTVGTLALTSSSRTFQTIASPFSEDVDTLRLELIEDGTNAMALDNFNVTVTGAIGSEPSGAAVPEPSSYALFAMGLFGLFGFVRWQRAEE